MWVHVCIYHDRTTVFIWHKNVTWLVLYVWIYWLQKIWSMCDYDKECGRPIWPSGYYRIVVWACFMSACLCVHSPKLCTKYSFWHHVDYMHTGMIDLNLLVQLCNFECKFLVWLFRVEIRQIFVRITTQNVQIRTFWDCIENRTGWLWPSVWTMLTSNINNLWLSP